jgi:hypothetical protein
MWTGLVWLRIGTGGKLLWIWYWTFGFHKMLGNYWCVQTTRVLLSSVQIHRVSKLVTYLKTTNLKNTDPVLHSCNWICSEVVSLFPSGNLKSSSTISTSNATDLIQDYLSLWLTIYVILKSYTRFLFWTMFFFLYFFFFFFYTTYIPWIQS